MKAMNPIPYANILSTAAIAKNVMVNFDGAVCGAGLRCLGVALVDFDSGEIVGVNRGVCIVKAGAAITAGAGVESDSTGRVVTLASGVRCGMALEAASAANDLILVALD